MPECNYFKGVILNFSSCMQFLHLHENFSIVFMYDHESERKARHQFGPVVFFANCSREQWMSEVQNHIREKGCSRADAISAVPFLYYHTGHYYCLETKLQPSCTLRSFLMTISVPILMRIKLLKRAWSAFLGTHIFPSSLCSSTSKRFSVHLVQWIYG